MCGVIPLLPPYPSWHERKRLFRSQVNRIVIFMRYKITAITAIVSTINNNELILNISLKKLNCIEKYVI